MLYRFLKIPARIAFYFYCRRLVVNDPNVFNSEGPLLIAANHPNSFLDAVILATLFDRPITSLVRGDVYKGKFIVKFLRALNMIPVFRISEGSENLGQNYETFLACKEIFRKKGIVLIFSEARCENEWHLRPLRKGTARLAFTAWEAGIPLKVLPAGLNYHSFKRFGKIVHLNFGRVIECSDVDLSEPFGKASNHFNRILKEELEKLVYEIPLSGIKSREKVFNGKPSPLLRVTLAIPAITGYILHAPLYFPIKFFTEKYFGSSGHYDSVIIALLFLLYPFYILIAGLLLWMLGLPLWILAILPLTSLCLLHFRHPGR